MAAEIITKEDLEEFRQKLLNDIKVLLGKPSEEPKKWLKSYQVKNMLRISSGTLQNLRANGTLSYMDIPEMLTPVTWHTDPTPGFGSSKLMT